jgi:hypothetical protein
MGNKTGPDGRFARNVVLLALVLKLEQGKNPKSSMLTSVCAIGTRRTSDDLSVYGQARHV